MRVLETLALAFLLCGFQAPATAADSSLIPQLEQLAKSGNAEAFYHLGMAYHMGIGVAEDRAKALEAFRKATALGDPLAAYKLGCYFHGQGGGLVADDPEQALKYKLIAAEAGYSLAQHDVGLMYGRSGDPIAALRWLEKSAAQGFPGALMTLARMYNGAPGIEADAAKTDAYFRLYMAQTKPGDEQKAWLKRFEDGLPADARSRADRIVETYRPAPTPLTLSALSGHRAATRLVAGAG